jgi:DNA-binding CsgD family transcriptional regulator
MEWPFHGRDGELRGAVGTVMGADRSGVIVTGPAFVGRSRFLVELADAISRRDGIAHRMTATRSSRGLPFAVLGPLAPSDVDRPGSWLDELVGRAGGPEATVVIDDAQWLDPATAQLVLSAAAQRALRVALAARTGERPPPAVTAAWKDGHLERIELGTLDRGGTDALVIAALGGTVASAVLQELWDLTHGYPLVLREFVEGAVASGALVDDDGLWVAQRRLEPPLRYIELVRDLRADVPEAVADALDLVALGEPLDVDVLDRLVAVDAVAALERGGVVSLDARTRRYRITAPGTGMALRAAIAPAAARRLSRRLSAALADDDPTGDDLVRFAVWRLDGGSPPDPAVLVRAARHAAGGLDHATAERLARTALPSGDPDAFLILADALLHQHRHADAERYFVGAMDVAGTDAHRAAAASGRARLLAFRLGRMEEAIEVLEAACDEVVGGDEADHLRATLARLLTLQGDLAGAQELCELVLDREGASLPAQASASVSTAYALMVRGYPVAGLDRCRAVEVLADGTEEHGDPLVQATLGTVAVVSELYAGRFRDAEQRARRGYAGALRRGAEQVSGLWATQVASVQQYQGRIDEARRYAMEGRELLAASDTLGIHTLACAIGAACAAEAGDVADAQRLLDEFHRIRVLVDARSQHLEDRAIIAVTAAIGELETAARLARDAVERALGWEHRTWALLAAHQALRLGYAEPVLDLIDGLGERSEGLLLPTIAVHARALADRDVDALEDVGRRFQALGALLWAAEVHAQASRIAGELGARQRASLLRAGATFLLARCPGAATPAVRGLAVMPLTRREHEVALLAARGLTSRQVAERLVVSARTVDNHLASVYRKLDISGREQLPDALAVDPDRA